MHSNSSFIDLGISLMKKCGKANAINIYHDICDDICMYIYMYIYIHVYMYMYTYL